MPQVSNYIEEIIEKKPSWLIRFGISGLLLLLLTLLFVSWWVKYPDVIKASVHISTSTPPVDLICPSNARIEKIFCKNSKSKITRRSPLILLKSTSDYKQIQNLKFFLQVLSNDSLLENVIAIPENFTKLGQLQNTFSQLTTYLKKF